MRIVERLRDGRHRGSGVEDDLLEAAAEIERLTALLEQAEAALAFFAAEPLSTEPPAEVDYLHRDAAIHDARALLAKLHEGGE